MTVSVKIIKDSISPDGVRLTTIQARYPRMVHGEVLTHRALSRNGRSSRAVPIVTLLKEEVYTPFFMKNQPGMVATQEFKPWKRKLLEFEWKVLAGITKLFVGHWAKLGVHKQWGNRPLEWFGYIDVLITSTEWNNFFALRDEAGAQPEIEKLAQAVKVALAKSNPERVPYGEWHLPYIEEQDWLMAEDYVDSYGEKVELLKKISVARCARLTIRPFDGDGSFEKELKRYEKLMVSRPIHASPAEHQATPDSKDINGDWREPEEHGNFVGWRQFRKQIPNNTVY